MGSDRRSLRVWLLVVALAVLVLVLVRIVLLPELSARTNGFTFATSGTLATRYTNGRSGAYLLPRGYEDHSLPLLALLHGTGGNGLAVLPLVRDEATARSFVVVAPDSEFPDHWDVPEHPGETTRDSEHVIACVREAMAMEHVTIDRQRVLVVGFSGGGSTAPYEASTYDEFTAFAVLHGGAFPAAFGPRRVRGWFATGQEDPLRPVGMVSRAADSVRAEGFHDVTFNVYPGGHEVSPAELHALLDWWLGQ